MLRLRRFGLALIGTTLLSCACSSSGTTHATATVGAWPVFRGDLARDGHPSSAALSVAEARGLSLSWRVRLNGPVDGSAIVTAERVLIGSQGGDLVALSAQTGSMLWKRTGLGPITGSVAVDGPDVLVATLSGHVKALTLASGGSDWDWKAPGEQPAIWSTPTVYAGKVLIGVASQAGDLPLESGRIVALGGGRQAWELCARPGCMPGGGIWSTPAIDSAGRAFVGVGNPEDGLLAFDAATGKRLWQSSFYADAGRDLDVGATPVVLDLGGREVVGVGSVSGLFKLFDASTGATVWSRELVSGSAVHGLIASPAYDGTNFYVGSAGSPAGMYALRPADGSVRWSVPTALPVYSAPAAGDGALVFGEGNVFGDVARGRVITLDVSNGNPVWSYETGAAVRSGPVIAGNLVVVGDSAGDVLAFAPKS